MIYLAIITCLILSSCKHEDYIEKNEISFLIEEVTYDYSKPNDDFKCFFTNDTIDFAITSDYGSAIKLLNSNFDLIDNYSISLKSKKYCKSLIVADFCYRLFSTQFLGPQIGKLPYIWHQTKWEELSLEEQFNYANEFKGALYCEERTEFYIRLLKKFLNIDARKETVENIHTFPVVRIHNKEYIIDPYDPFVIIDTTNNTVVDYQNLITNSSEEYMPIHTNRKFGQSRMLISKKMFNENHHICSNINEFLISKFELLKEFENECYKMNFPDTFLINPLKKDSNNIFSIKFNGRPDSPFYKNEHLLNFYTEKGCYKYANSKNT